MSVLKFRIGFMLVALLLVGCKSVDKLGENDKYQDKVLTREKALVLPHDLKNTSMDDYYPVPRPRINDGKKTAKNLTLPPGSQL